MALFRKIALFISLAFLHTAGVAQTVEELISSGINYENNGEHSKAIASFTKAIELEPALAVAWYNRGVSRIASKQYSLAVVDMNKTIYLDTAFIDAYYMRYVAYVNTKNYQFALADLSFYLDKFPNDTQAHYEKYELLVTLEEYDEASAELNWLIKNTKAALVFREALADIKTKQGKHGEAERIYTELLNEFPSEKSYYLSRAYARNKNANYTASMDDINLYLLNQPKDKEARKLKADNFFFMNDFSSAMVIYESLLSADTLNSGLVADIGHCLLQLNRFNDAEVILTKAIRMKNDAPAYAYLGRGIARMKLEKGDEACQDWEKSLKLGEKKAQKYLEEYCKKQ
jgi:tetratricopeptide (TPR) repeat protein